MGDVQTDAEAQALVRCTRKEEKDEALERDSGGARDFSAVAKTGTNWIHPLCCSVAYTHASVAQQNRLGI